MAGHMQSEQLNEEDFSEILYALSATAKGRHFLAEHLRRYRPQENRMLLDALHRIEATVRLLRDQIQPERLASEMRRIASTLDIAVEDARETASSADDWRRGDLLARASADLTALALALTGDESTESVEDEPDAIGGPAQAGAPREASADFIVDDLRFADQLDGDASAAPEVR